MDNPDFSGAQLGDLEAGNIASNIYNVSSEQAIKLLSGDITALAMRLDTLERATAQHANERQAMTRMVISLASEAATVSDTHTLLERQIAAETAERAQRRRYLDAMLTSLVVLAFINLVMHVLSRVRRRSGRAA